MVRRWKLCSMHRGKPFCSMRCCRPGDSITEEFRGTCYGIPSEQWGDVEPVFAHHFSSVSSAVWSISGRHTLVSHPLRA